MQKSEAKGIKTRTVALGAAASILLALLAAYLGSTDKQAPEASAPSASTDASVRFGPGVWTDPAQESEGGVADTSAPDGLTVTADQHLVINRALKDVFDYFLLGGHLGAREEHTEKLRAHLKASLPGPAFQEADKIIRNYVAYLDAHDTLLAREAVPSANPDSLLAPPDIERVSAWLAQRARLRQELLGLHIAQAWFGEEEIQDQQSIAAMRQRGATPFPQSQASTTQTGSTGLQEMREKNASYGEQRELVRSRFGEQAAQRFDAIEGQERAWKTQYAGYRQAVENILRQPGLDAAERARQITTLRQQTFTTEQERLRAENLDNLPPPAL